MPIHFGAAGYVAADCSQLPSSTLVTAPETASAGRLLKVVLT